MYKCILNTDSVEHIKQFGSLGFGLLFVEDRLKVFVIEFTESEDKIQNELALLTWGREQNFSLTFQTSWRYLKYISSLLLFYTLFTNLSYI